MIRVHIKAEEAPLGNHRDQNLVPPPKPQFSEKPAEGEHLCLKVP